MMREKYLKIICIISFLLNSPLILFSAEKSNSMIDSSQSKTTKGFITVTSKVDSLIVYLDSLLLGDTPIYDAEIDTGKHTLSVLNPKRSNWVEQDWERDFTIVPNDTQSFEIEFKQFYYINSIPHAAHVFYNDKLQGLTPIIVSLNPQSNDLLIIRKEGYLDFATRLHEHSERFFNVKLKVDKISKQEKSRFAVVMKHHHTRRKVITYSTIGLSIVSGLSSIYFQKRADEKYDEYMNAGDPNQMDRLYQDTKRLDKYASISYGIFQASFVLSIYLFLTGRN